MVSVQAKSFTLGGHILLGVYGILVVQQQPWLGPMGLQVALVLKWVQIEVRVMDLCYRSYFPIVFFVNNSAKQPRIDDRTVCQANSDSLECFRLEPMRGHCESQIPLALAFVLEIDSNRILVGGGMNFLKRYSLPSGQGAALVCTTSSQWQSWDVVATSRGSERHHSMCHVNSIQLLAFEPIVDGI
ncbi:hypothetical protein B0A52_09739 [Exophiala mesophila]|uniref:Uncharacterized protein n=1 Tax=Exophiala mesophila TaxID=212818 RepID=A0A438MTI7_EXOME|nr:hypothetical protein B0A52_09739 [Exophiala mesophila]